MFLQDSRVFLFGVVILEILLCRNLRPTDLPLVISGNADMLMYLKMGAYLLHFPDTTVQSGTTVLWVQSRIDVFGTFNLLAFSAFIGKTGIENTPIPVASLAIGIAITAITRICRRFYGLTAFEAFSIAILVATSALIVYLLYNFFLAQLYFIALFLLALMVVLLFVKEDSGGNSYIRLSLFMMLPASCIIFVYHVWYFQFVAIFYALIAYSFLIKSGRLAVGKIAKASVIFILAASSCLAVAACLLPERFLIAARTVIYLARVPNAGWPFGFVNPQLMLGVPAAWDMHNPDGPVWTVWVPVVLMMLFVVLVVERFHRDGRLSLPVFTLPLLAFFVSLVLYLIVWLHYGFSYQQWKFATTLPLPLGFTLTASLVYALTANGGGERAIAARLVALCLVGGIGVNVYDVIHRWGKQAFHFSKNLTLARQAKPVEGGDLVYVNAPDYLERMTAAVFINAKLIAFSGVTYFGPGTNPAAKPQANVTEFYRIAVGCGFQTDADGPAQYGIRVTAWDKLGGTEKDLTVGTKVDFSKDVSKCLTLTGISGIESWGRWTDGSQASIKFQCQCDGGRHLAVKLEAGAFLYPKLRDAQRVTVRVNGAEPVEFRLTSMDPKPLLIPIPALPADKVIRMTIDLPDAVSPLAIGSADKRVLGLSLRSLQLIADPPRNDGKS